MFIMTVSQTKTVEEEKCAFLILGFTVPLRIQNWVYTINNKLYQCNSFMLF